MFYLNKIQRDLNTIINMLQDHNLKMIVKFISQFKKFMQFQLIKIEIKLKKQ